MAAKASLVIFGLDTTQTPPLAERSWALFISLREDWLRCDPTGVIPGDALSGPR